MKFVAPMTMLFLTSSFLVAQECDGSKATLNDLPFLEVVSVQVLLQADSLASLQENCNEEFRVSSFKAKISNGVSIHSNNNRITDEMKLAFAQLSDGDQVTFESIKTVQRANPHSEGTLTSLTVHVMKGEGY